MDSPVLRLYEEIDEQLPNGIPSAKVVSHLKKREAQFLERLDEDGGKIIAEIRQSGVLVSFIFAFDSDLKLVGMAALCGEVVPPFVKGRTKNAR
jgi:hypothetical protein